MTEIRVHGTYREVLSTGTDEGFKISGVYREALISGSAGASNIHVSNMYREVLMAGGAAPANLRRWRVNIN